ncbi:MAG: hypothetical protein OFPI_17700 [Osedax symbiont Rs2]|nr:MAG: hypothetical protein OFPI_17700 [Osedax symbiont Rs2]
MATGISKPAISTSDSALVVACSTETLPNVVVKANNSICGCAMAVKIAIASSMPGSVSKIIFFIVLSHLKLLKEQRKQVYLPSLCTF